MEHQDERGDHSLRQLAWERARGETVPRTLTAWEWEEWYARHGVPQSHRVTDPALPAVPRWRQWLRRLTGAR